MVSRRSSSSSSVGRNRRRGSGRRGPPGRARRLAQVGDQEVNVEPAPSTRSADVDLEDLLPTLVPRDSIEGGACLAGELTASHEAVHQIWMLTSRSLVSTPPQSCR